MAEEEQMNARSAMLCAACAAIVCTGCADIAVGAGARLAIDATYFDADLDGSIEAVPPWGVAVTDNPEHDWNVAPVAAAYASAGLARVSVFGELGARVNTLHWDDGYRDGMYGVARDVADPSTYIFSQVTPGWYSLIPSVGGQVRFPELTVRAGVGFPYMEWEARSGYDFPDEEAWQTVNKDSWTGFGARYFVDFSYGEDTNSGLFLSLFFEDFDTSFGDVYGPGVLAGWELRF
jgi:hypothetical protein